MEVDFGVLDTMLVTDRGLVSEENLAYLDRKKAHYLVALKRTKVAMAFMEEALRADAWERYDEKTRFWSVVVEDDRLRRFVVGFNDEIAWKARAERAQRLRWATGKLRALQRAIRRGTCKSRKDRDRRTGHILRRYKAGKLLECRGHRTGLGFSFRRNDRENRKAARYDGMYVLMTTRVELDGPTVLRAYRERDRIEKSIRTLKGILDLRPIFVRTVRHVKGHVFVCALAYQLRSMLRVVLRQGGSEQSADEALETLRSLRVVGLFFSGEEVRVVRRLTRQDAPMATLVETLRLGPATERVCSVEGT